MSTASTNIDASTAEVIRSAMTLAQAGRLQEACEIGRRGLSEGADPAPLNAMLGALLCRVGDYSAAIPHLREAQRDRPGDPIIVRNLAIALTAEERYADLLPLLTNEVLANDPSDALRRFRGFAAQMTGDLAAAAADFEQVIARHPDDWETLNNLGNVRVDAGDFPGAIEALRRASELNPRLAPTRLNLARVLREAGELAEAEAVLRSMADDFPGDSKPLEDLYHIIRVQGREESEAEEALAQASQRDPKNVDLLVELGAQRIRSANFAKAEPTFRSALDLEPSNGPAFYALAQVLEHLRPDDLPELLAAAEAAEIDEDRLKLMRAFVARRAKRHREALDALAGVPDELETAARWHLAGQMHDALGEYDLAFEAFRRMNAAHEDDESQPIRRAAELRDQVSRQIESMTGEWRSSWKAPAINAERPAPVFLAGFPRSGTTLLDTMLMGHPDVEVMEEKPMLRKLEVEFGGFDELASFDEKTVRDAQRRYFEMAAEYVPLREGSVLVDKSPLYLQRVPQICRLFPDARFILALRHPADVVLSCFMANFRLNSSMSNFLRLDTAAEFYDLSFKSWERALALFPVPVQTVVYEQMIDDPEAALRPVVEGLGLEWRPEVVDHERTARDRGVVTTASYAQVTQPLYRGAIGRWERYRAHLEPILPALRPWAEKFGYEL